MTAKSVFDHFDRISVINLKFRDDRRAQMRQQIDMLGLDIWSKVDFVSAIRPSEKGPFDSIGARGCYESHLSILNQAANANEAVLILEDDCNFTNNAGVYALDESWDIFYGGYKALSPEDLQKSDIVGSHMMGFSANGAKMVSKYLRELNCLVDHPPIDAAYVWFRRSYPSVITHFAVPSLAYQRPSRTDIAQLAFYDRWIVLKDIAQYARTIKTLYRKK